MATFVLVHGGGGTAWSWSFVAEKLEGLGHETVAMDLPGDDPKAEWSDYADAVVEAVGDRTEIILVAHSAGGFVAPLVCGEVDVKLIVLVASMIPAPGETFMEWWENTGYGDYATEFSDDADLFYNGVPPELVAEDTKRGEGRENVPEEAWPMDAWPDVPTKYMLFRDDNLFSPEFARKVAKERLGIVPDEIAESDGGHMVMLSRPEELASRLDAYWKDIQ